jgi:hypothetical protein
MSATAVLVTGTVGVGKSATADWIGSCLRAARVPHAVIDLDEIRQYWPTPRDDPFGFEIGLGNLNPMVAPRPEGDGAETNVYVRSSHFTHFATCVSHRERTCMCVPAAPVR